MKPTMTELMGMLGELVTKIEASRAPDLPEDIAAYRRWQEELNGLAGRLGALAAGVEA